MKIFNKYMRICWLRVSWMVVGALIGFCMGCLFLDAERIHFDSTLNAGNLLHVITMLVIAIVVGTIISSKKHADETEKEIVLAHFDSLYNSVNELEKYTDGGLLAEINSTLKNISLAQQSLADVIKCSSCSESLIKLVSFREEIIEFRKLCTETPIKDIFENISSSEFESRVKDGVILLAKERQLLIKTKLQQLKIKIMKAKLEANRSY